MKHITTLKILLFAAATFCGGSLFGAIDHMTRHTTWHRVGHRPLNESLHDTVQVVKNPADALILDFLRPSEDYPNLFLHANLMLSRASHLTLRNDSSMLDIEALQELAGEVEQRQIIGAIQIAPGFYITSQEHNHVAVYPLMINLSSHLGNGIGLGISSRSLVWRGPVIDCELHASVEANHRFRSISTSPGLLPITRLDGSIVTARINDHFVVLGPRNEIDVLLAASAQWNQYTFDLGYSFTASHHGPTRVTPRSFNDHNQRTLFNPESPARWETAHRLFLGVGSHYMTRFINVQREELPTILGFGVAYPWRNEPTRANRIIGREQPSMWDKLVFWSKVGVQF